MATKKNLIIGIVVVVCVIILAVIIFTPNNEIAGTYQEKYSSFVLNDNGTYEYYNGVSDTITKGKYSYVMSDDDKRAIVTFTFTSGSSLYDGAVIFAVDNKIYLVPTIKGSEVIARTMVKTK